MELQLKSIKAYIDQIRPIIGPFYKQLNIDVRLQTIFSLFGDKLVAFALTTTGISYGSR